MRQSVVVRKRVQWSTRTFQERENGRVPPGGVGSNETPYKKGLQKVLRGVGSTDTEGITGVVGPWDTQYVHIL